MTCESLISCVLIALMFVDFTCSSLLTIPSSVGYEQNPLSLYYCYETEGSAQHLKKCIAEVIFSISHV